MGNIVFYNNQFISNIGMFGGAITIDSPDNTNNSVGNTSYIIVKNNYFETNMAYISGNAFYIRLTKQVS